uniref:Uncharacterized protein n=1 Tax=Anguilla anguilla TaxID=7936 RepID=A0A0E9QTE9_ANGAN
MCFPFALPGPLVHHIVECEHVWRNKNVILHKRVQRYSQIFMWRQTAKCLGVQRGERIEKGSQLRRCQGRWSQNPKTLWDEACQPGNWATHLIAVTSPFKV